MPLEDHESFSCPHCGSENLLPIDFSGGARQQFVVDCETCCAPIVIDLKLNGEEIVYFAAEKENG